MPDSQIKVDYIDSMGSDLTVVNAARVSFDKESSWEWSWFKSESAAAIWGNIDTDYVSSDRWAGDYPAYRLSEKDAKLILYLAKHKHLSPFGHCFASFRVTAPVFVRAQLVKHEYLRMNEISRRYVDTEPEFYIPDVWRGKAKDKKQGSDGVVDIPKEVGYRELYNEQIEWYDYLLSKGVAPEQARMVLPQSMMTSWWWSGSLDAFANMCNLRLKPDAQYETRLVAQQIDKYMAEIFPVSWRALVSVY